MLALRNPIPSLWLAKCRGTVKRRSWGEGKGGVKVGAVTSWLRIIPERTDRQERVRFNERSTVRTPDHDIRDRVARTLVRPRTALGSEF